MDCLFGSFFFFLSRSLNIIIGKIHFNFSHLDIKSITSLTKPPKRKKKMNASWDNDFPEVLAWIWIPFDTLYLLQISSFAHTINALWELWAAWLQVELPLCPGTKRCAPHQISAEHREGKNDYMKEFHRNFQLHEYSVYKAYI